MLTGAGLLLRSLWHLQGEGTGFDARQVLTAKVSISAREYNDARAAAFFEQLTTRLRAAPGVTAVGASGWLPVVDAGGLWGFRPEGGIFPEGRWPSAVPQQVTPGYFAAVGLPLIQGRDILPTDRDGTPYVAVVSRKFAEQSWPSANPIGKRFRLGPDSIYLTVVGIVGDIRSRGFGDTPEPTMYFPHAQAAKSAYVAPRAMAILLRSGGDPLTYAATIRNAVRALDPTAPVSEVRSLERVIATSIENRKFSTALLTGFAALALLLAGIGTYGVISYSVSQRTYEIGVRMALGAERERVIALVMWEGMRMAGLGLIIGLAGSIAMSRLIRSMLVGVTAFDAPTFAAVALLLGLVAIAASSIPARRASGVSPVEALRG
jgi:predicted permease